MESSKFAWDHGLGESSNGPMYRGESATFHEPNIWDQTREFANLREWSVNKSQNDSNTKDYEPLDPLSEEQQAEISEIPIERLSESDVLETDLPMAEEAAAGGMGIEGVVAGTINSAVMDSYSNSKLAAATSGNGPQGHAFNFNTVANQTSSNEKFATSIGSAALGIGGAFGPEGLLAGAAVAGAIDIAEISGGFEASNTVNSNFGNSVDPNSVN